MGLQLPGNQPPGSSYPNLELSDDEDEEDAAEWETRKRKELCYDVGTSVRSLTTLFTTPPRATDVRKSYNTHQSVAGDGTQEAWPHAPKANQDTLKPTAAKNNMEGLLKIKRQ